MSNSSASSSVSPPQPPVEGWTRNKFLFLIAFALAVHVALLFIFGTKKQIVSRPLGKVPHLRLADNADEFTALGNPTLFARPNARDLVTTFWRRTPEVPQPWFNSPEAPRFLPPAPERLGAAFGEFMRASRPAALKLNFKPEPELTTPVLAPDDTMPRATSMQIAGELAQRPRLDRIEPPSIAVNDVIAPSKVQALVNTDGNVASAVLLESSSLADADQRALQLVRNLRFAPASRLMFGEIIFTWHTVPTNAP